jgi:uncharacterized protein involved in exopolysaccharide biosynthesis
MSQTDFLARLQTAARAQAARPPSHNRFTAFFWRHAWQFWLAAAIGAALIYEFHLERCP